jgi:hypothetical protein
MMLVVGALAVLVLAGLMLCMGVSAGHLEAWNAPRTDDRGRLDGADVFMLWNDLAQSAREATQVGDLGKMTRSG